MRRPVAVLFVLALSASAFAFEKTAYTMKDDFGSEPVYDCYMNYYYYVPCPTLSWFWGFQGWSRGDVIGVFFSVGDVSMFTGSSCDPLSCRSLRQIRVLDFAGYGSIYPGRFTVEMEVYCSDGQGCPIGPALWSSGPWETGYAWNYIPLRPALCLPDCSVQAEPALGYPSILVTATMVGTDAGYPQWGFDNISSTAATGCRLHDYSCLAALYPRPYSSQYSTVHSGYYGRDFTYCPPRWFCDGRDSSPERDEYGFIEAAWRIYLGCGGPSLTQPDTWNSIKSVYR